MLLVEHALHQLLVHHNFFASYANLMVQFSLLVLPHQLFKLDFIQFLLCLLSRIQLVHLLGAELLYPLDGLYILNILAHNPILLLLLFLGGLGFLDVAGETSHFDTRNPPHLLVNLTGSFQHPHFLLLLLVYFFVALLLLQGVDLVEVAGGLLCFD